MARRSWAIGRPAAMTSSSITALACGSSTFHWSSDRSDGYRGTRSRHQQPRDGQRVANCGATG